jgi:hypothetical protein
VRIAVLVLVAGCGFSTPGARSDASPDSDVPIDAAVDAPDVPIDARGICIGTFVTVCREVAPADHIALNKPETIDTDVDPRCAVQPQGPGLPALCVMAGRDVKIDDPIIAIGSRPLVLVAFRDLNVTSVGSLVLTSPRGGAPGAGANDPGCSTPTAGGNLATGAGGGAGGSLGGSGGGGGTGGAGVASAGMAGAPHGTPARVIGGCRGSSGGQAGASTGGAGGNGGGAVMLIARNKMTIAGVVTAGGGGGDAAANLAGGGGGGSGGFIGLDAATYIISATATLAANGGGGASGGGAPLGDFGDDGKPALLPALGGVAPGVAGGGNGSLTTTVGGGGTPGAGGGGGGGGSGGVILVVGATSMPAMHSPQPIFLP